MKDSGGPCSMAAVPGKNLGIPLFHHTAAFRGRGQRWGGGVVKPYF